MSAGHRAWVPPDPVPNSEVKPRSVPRCIVVFGHENLGTLLIIINFITILSFLVCPIMWICIICQNWYCVHLWIMLNN